MKLPSRYKPTGTHFVGGQAVVGVWKDSSLNRDVAVKVLSTRGIGGSLLDEAALLAAIKSKHVVELFEIGTDASTGKDYLIMEYVSGDDLDGYTPTTRRELYLTLYQIAAGIADIHTAKCIHRDIKPPNMRRDAADVIKIIDFGLGAAADPVVTKLGRGTDGYRAPEYDNDPTKLTAAVDVYAFGAVAYEFCFCALHPGLLRTPPAKPPSFATAAIGKTAAKLDAQVVQVLDRCFESNPADRPSAAELRDVLGKHLLRAKHVGKFVHQGTSYTLSHASKGYKITGAKGGFELTYNGLDFVFVRVTGDVYVNGQTANAGMALPGSCVITIGSGSGPDRDFIPFNVSHPEVVL
jgi:eukaryotic-like serine/threonine-protein kinase